MSKQVSNDFAKYGGSYLLSNNNYEDYAQGKDLIGRSDGQFMIPSNQMNDLLENYPNNPREWEKQLGLDKNSLGDSDIHRVDVYNPLDYEPRLPTKDLSGANDKFIEGGKTPGGQDECVINRFPNPESNQSVGKISTIDNSISNAPSANSVTISSSNIESIYGGGARAPDVHASNQQFNPEDYISKTSATESIGKDVGSGIKNFEAERQTDNEFINHQNDGSHNNPAVVNNTPDVEVKKDGGMKL